MIKKNAGHIKLLVFLAGAHRNAEMLACAQPRRVAELADEQPFLLQLLGERVEVLQRVFERGRGGDARGDQRAGGQRLPGGRAGEVDVAGGGRLGFYHTVRA